MLDYCFELIGQSFEGVFNILEVAELRLNFMETLISLIAFGGIISLIIVPFIGRLKSGKGEH